MALSAKIKRAKEEAELFAKELKLMGYEAYVPQKRNSVVLCIRLAGRHRAEVRTWKGRWCLMHGPRY